MVKTVFEKKNKVLEALHFPTFKLTTKLSSTRVPTQLREERTVILMSNV